MPKHYPDLMGGMYLSQKAAIYQIEKTNEKMKPEDSAEGLSSNRHKIGLPTSHSEMHVIATKQSAASVTDCFQLHTTKANST